MSLNRVHIWMRHFAIIPELIWWNLFFFQSPCRYFLCIYLSIVYSDVINSRVNIWYEYQFCFIFLFQKHMEIFNCKKLWKLSVTIPMQLFEKNILGNRFLMHSRTWKRCSNCFAAYSSIFLNLICCCWREINEFFLRTLQLRKIAFYAQLKWNLIFPQERENVIAII